MLQIALRVSSKLRQCQDILAVFLEILCFLEYVDHDMVKRKKKK